MNGLNGTNGTHVQPKQGPVTVAIVGAGQRGHAYAVFCSLNPELARVVAIAEPRPKSRAHLASLHPHARIFANYQELLAASDGAPGGKLADGVVVAVQDSMHLEVVEASAKRRYDMLCEKPMATSLADCRAMTEAVERAGVIFGIGHVLRYSPFNATLVDILRSGELGEIVNITHLEPVGHWHFAHSYVRGNWRDEKASSFALMTKCCHDLDILLHYMRPAKLARVSSFGSLTHFKRAKKPKAAGDATRCVDCAVKDTCPYSATKIYLEPIKAGFTEWPVHILTDGPPDVEGVTRSLDETDYGKCVYELENDVCDHQVVNMEWDNGATASMTMAAFSELICERQTRVHGSLGEAVGDSHTLRVNIFGDPARSRTLHPESQHSTDRQAKGGHGDGDMGLMRNWVEAVRTRDQTVLGVTVREALLSHEAVFAAEKSRREGRVVALDSLA